MDTSKSTSPHELACKLAETYRDRDMNEADTRHQIIDVIVHDVFAWPRNAVTCEEDAAPGYVDYVFRKSSGGIALILEAKRQGAYFKLPIAYNHKKRARYIAIRTLLTDVNTRKAIDQARGYCLQNGAEFGAISNGHEWVFFRSFERDKPWPSTRAFVLTSLDYFSDEFTDASTWLNYSAINERFALRLLFDSSKRESLDRFLAKDKIAPFNEPVSSNKLARILRPLADKYFGVLTTDDPEFMTRCYVARSDQKNNRTEVRNLIRDRLTPYFKGYGIRDVVNDEDDGEVARKLKKAVRTARPNQVIVLFGGKGSGKSTFLRRLLYHKPPSYLKKHAVIATVDLLQQPEDKAQIHDTTWKRVISQLDINGILDSDRNTILQLFDDRYQIATKQDLFGIDPTSEFYNTKLNSLIATWKQDLPYVAARLADQLRRRHKGIIVVMDNTDQYSPPIQDYCFATAQEISAVTGCVALLTMREERFYDSKIHGLLDAFQNSGFHISSPVPHIVFKKRIEYVLSLLNKRQKGTQVGIDATVNDISDAVDFFNVLAREFGRKSSPLNDFLDACAHGDIRLALDLFRGFLISGYTNTSEMISRPTWNVSIHQVLKPVMAPDRFFYDEAISNVPNIYRLRSPQNSSHFTALRVLHRLLQTGDVNHPPYVSVAELRTFFVDTLDMADDLQRNLDVLLKQGFVEANNRIDELTPGVDMVKITNYGRYMYENLYGYFAYLDLVCTDGPVHDESLANYLVQAAHEDFRLFKQHKKLERIQVRLDKAEEFVNYLCREEAREIELYGEEIADLAVSARLTSAFQEERTRVYSSARKNTRRS